MTGQMVKLPEDEDTPAKRVDKLFAMMDKDKNAQLSFEEFQEGCVNPLTLYSTPPTQLSALAGQRRTLQ